MPGGIAQPLRVTAQRKPSRGTTAAGRKRPWRAALYGANAVAPWGDSKPPHPTIQLHPVLASAARRPWSASWAGGVSDESPHGAKPDRKSTRLNSSHSQISYAVFCLKKKKKTILPH